MVITKQWIRFFTLVATSILMFSGLAISLLAFSTHQARASDDDGFNVPWQSAHLGPVQQPRD